MNDENFTIVNYSISHILSLIGSGEFVIPEIQRPFVWNKVQVRDLIDSLYHDYPIGYIITWINPDVIGKDGVKAKGKRILIDGQQRITALMAAILGREVLNDDFRTERIRIAFNPIAVDETKRFAVQDASHTRDKRWIPDISLVFSESFKSRPFEDDYVSKNPEVDVNDLSEIIDKLKTVKRRKVGVIELSSALEIDVVTEIFTRINSKGSVLNQADFVMSKMAADGDFENGHGGSLQRRAVDYFCHLAVKPEFLTILKNDQEFRSSHYYSKIKWVADYNEEIYIPDYRDALRVSFMHQFQRGRLADLVSLLSGRHFETKEYRDEVVKDSFEKLGLGISNFVNQHSFTQFVLAIKAAGFVSQRLLSSQMTLNFAYTLYLMLSKDNRIPKERLKWAVQKWFVLSTLTSRYTGSSETAMGRDIRNLQNYDFLEYLKDVESSELSDNFWEVTLPQRLDTSSRNSPFFNTFTAAQINKNVDSLFMNGLKVSDLITVSGEIHHIFPRAYLKEYGIKSVAEYNQVANYVYLDAQVNKSISNKPPNQYFTEVLEQSEIGVISLGNITNRDNLGENLKNNAIPKSIYDHDYRSYRDFLAERRKSMALFIRDYYLSL